MRYFLLLPLNLFAPIANLLLAPLVVPFADKDGWLPKWLWWFQTPDNSLDAEDGHSTRPKGDYWRRLGWLYRNPMYGFDIGVLGAALNSSDAITVWGDLGVRNRPQGRAGKCLIRIGRYWFFRWVIRIGSAHCLDIQLGWKLQRYAEYPELLVNGAQAQYCFSPRPNNFVA